MLLYYTDMQIGIFIPDFVLMHAQWRHSVFLSGHVVCPHARQHVSMALLLAWHSLSDMVILDDSDVSFVFRTFLRQDLMSLPAQQVVQWHHKR